MGCRVLIGMRGLILLPLFANRPEDYSVLGQSLLAISVVLPFVTLRLEIAAVRFLVAESDPHRRRQRFSSLVQVAFGLALIAGIIAILARGFVSNVLYGSDRFVDVVLPLSILIAISALNAVLRSFFRIIDRIRSLALVELVEACAELSLIALLIWQDFGIAAVLWAIVSVRAAVAVVMAIAWVRPTIPKRADLRNMLKFSVPLIPNGLAAWTTSYADRLIIVAMMGLTSLSVYAAAFSLAAPLALVSGTTGFVLYPRLLKMWELGERESAVAQFYAILRWYPICALPACFVIATLSQPLLQLLGGETFLSSSPLVFVLATGIALQGLTRLSNYAMHFSQTTHFITLQLVVETILNVGLNLILIPRMGLMGAALSTSVACAVGLSMSFWFCWRHLHVKPPMRELLVSSSTILVCSILSFQVALDSWVSRTVAIVLVAVIYVLCMLLFRGMSLRELSGVIDAVMFRRVASPAVQRSST